MSAATLQAASAKDLRGGKYPALVLNADYSPLSYTPLSLWSWQESVRAIFRDVVTVLSEYDRVVRSPSLEIALPSVIVLRKYVNPDKRTRPAFTRRNLLLRDRYRCAYCEDSPHPLELTFDHVLPRARKGGTSWENVVVACKRCNGRKADRLLRDIPDMSLRSEPYCPTWSELQQRARLYPPKSLHPDWEDFM